MNTANILQKLQWDSDFFGKRIAKIELQDIRQNAGQINAMIADSSFDLVYCFAKPDEGTIEDIEGWVENAQWVDGKITYVKKVVKQDLIDVDLIQSVVNMENDLYNLAVQTGVYSRFHIDKKFGKTHYQELYKKWIENSVNRSIAREVAVYKENSKPEGMITIGEKNGRADIGLVGVDEGARGKGIASKLLKFAEVFAHQEGFKEIQVVTQQQNEPACRLYEKYGFRAETVVNIFHIWK